MNKLLAFLFLLGASGLRAQKSAAVSLAIGTAAVAVQDPSGAPVPGLTVTYSRVPVLSSAQRNTLAPGEFHLSGVVPTGGTANGQVVLPTGHYIFCANAGTTPFLDPCKWATAIHVNVVSGQTTPISIQVAKGVRLQVTISDPKHLLPADKRPTGPPPAIVGVLFGKGAFLAADCTSVTGSMSCSISIPAAVPFKMWVLNPTIGFTASDGSSVANSGVGPSFTAAAGVDRQFQFTASGSKLSSSFAP